MKIVARSGTSVYLIATDDEARGIVADLEEKVRYPAINIESILTRGYWEDFEHNDTLFKSLMELKQVDPE